MALAQEPLRKGLPGSPRLLFCFFPLICFFSSRIAPWSSEPQSGVPLKERLWLTVESWQLDVVNLSSTTQALVFSHLVFQEAAESSGGGRNGSLSVGLAGHIDCPIQALALCFLTAEVI